MRWNFISINSEANEGPHQKKELPGHLEVLTILDASVKNYWVFLKSFRHIFIRHSIMLEPKDQGGALGGCMGHMDASVDSSPWGPPGVDASRG